MASTVKGHPFSSVSVEVTNEKGPYDNDNGNIATAIIILVNDNRLMIEAQSMTLPTLRPRNRVKCSLMTVSLTVNELQRPRFNLGSRRGEESVGTYGRRSRTDY